MSKGKLFIFSGPSGSGKDSILQGALKKHPEIKLSISSITRPMRVGEVEGEKYHFISRDEFEELLANDMFLEHNVFVGNYYGTPRQPVEECLENGTDMIVEIDVNGAAQVMEKMPEAVSIFVMPPSLEVLKQRLSGRGTDTPEIVEKRLNEALREIECAVKYDYIIVNDKLEEAIDDLLTVILSERLRTERNKKIINEVLEKC